MPLILGTNSIKDTGYDVANSLRFNSGSSDDLVYTPSSTGNRRTFTWSVWVKRSKLGVGQMTIFKKEGSGSDTNGNGNADYLGLAYFNSDDTLQVARNQEGDRVNVKTTRVFRDVSAWYHIIVSIDTTQGTGSNRVRCWVNGTEESLTFTVTPTQNREFDFNQSGEAHHLGSSGNGSYLDGYLTECVFLDGTAVTGATDFGEFDEDTGIWKPKDVSELTFGTNGFYLDFEDSSALGNDVSGNNNDFTVNNLTSIDQTTDTCTNNYCTWNPLYPSANLTYSNGNNTVTSSSSSWTNGVTTGSTFAIDKGKWYWEVKWDNDSSFNGIALGVFETEDSQNNLNNYLGEASSGIGYFLNTNEYYIGGVAISLSSSFSQGDIISIALDMDNNYIYFGENGTFLNSGDPTSGSSGTGGIDISSFSGTLTPALSTRNNNTLSANFGNPPYSISSGNSDGNGYGNFEYSVPSGYYALNSKNLAEFG
jgi:hypothetical protein